VKIITSIILKYGKEPPDPTRCMKKQTQSPAAHPSWSATSRKNIPHEMDGSNTLSGCCLF